MDKPGANSRQLEIGVISRTDIVKFAGAGGDFNPIHHDDEFARASGYPSVFAMGIMTASMASRLVTDWFGIAAIKSYDVRFTAMVWPGEQLKVIGQTVVDAGQSPRQIIEFQVVNQAGDIKITGTAEVEERGGFAGKMATADLRRRSEHRPKANMEKMRNCRGIGKLEDRVGEIVRVVHFPLEVGKIAEFARAMKDPSAIYTDKEAASALGFGAVLAPLTFSAASAHYACGDATGISQRLGLDLSRTVHGQHRWEYTKPLCAGQILTGTTRLANVEQKLGRRGEMLRLLVETVFCDKAGDVAVTEKMLMIELPATQ